MSKALTEQFKYTEHERKPIIRNQWCLPQIQSLFKKLKKKLIYIGLPGIEALDIKAWLDYLDKVIAFQCSEYKEGRSLKQKIDVMQLDNLLEAFERADKLRSSIVYQGYMEDIVMGGLSERGQIYQQDDFLKIYNLDFCNQILTPRTIHDEKGNKTRYYKLQVLERLLYYQNIAHKSQPSATKFLLYLTVNSNSFSEDITKIKSKPFKDYFTKLRSISNKEVREVRMLKAYCFHEITRLFNQFEFHAEFLPPIFYQGSSYPNRHQGSRDEHHRMMTFTVLGTKKVSEILLYKQDESTFLNASFLSANNKNLICYKDAYIAEEAINPNAEELLSNSYTFKSLW